jgi:sec-independent protein translocase protein TatA
VPGPFSDTSAAESEAGSSGCRNRATAFTACRKGIFGLGVPELAVIAGVAALVFGPAKLPELGKAAGQTAKSFQEAAKEFSSELKKGMEVLLVSQCHRL